MIRSACFILAAFIVAAPAVSAVAPRVAARSFDQLARPLPLPYDEKADAEAAIKAAGGRARANGKLLMIDLGGNWCPDCRVLAGTIALPEVHRFIADHYELVMVDVGRFDHNMQVPEHLWVGQAKGVPSVLVIDPRADKLLNPGRTAALADARSMSPQALADWLAGWTR